MRIKKAGEKKKTIKAEDMELNKLYLSKRKYHSGEIIIFKKEDYVGGKVRYFAIEDSHINFLGDRREYINENYPIQSLIHLEEVLLVVLKNS